MCDICGYPDHFDEKHVSKSQAQMLFEAYVAAFGHWRYCRLWSDVLKSASSNKGVNHHLDTQANESHWARMADLYAEALSKAEGGK